LWSGYQIHRLICRSRLWKRRVEAELLPWALEGIDLGHNVLEIGPGPGLTTDVLRKHTAGLTALENDCVLASSLARRLAGKNVAIVTADATQIPFNDRSFSAVAAFTMLHHVRSAELQDCVLAEAYRVLQPGGIFWGTDSRYSWGMWLIHLRDTMVIVNPETMVGRLEKVGFNRINVESAKRAFRFHAKRPC
jgi:ubiquinone/menaquinone biosynthesis C-methylase UbiE